MKPRASGEALGKSWNFFDGEYKCLACHTAIPFEYVREHWMTAYSLPCKCNPRAYEKFAVWSITKVLAP